MIVIGGGLGGLSAASVLSRAGKRVAVVERDETAGGAIRPFRDQGYAFDVGFHFEGQMLEPGMCRTIVEQVIKGSNGSLNRRRRKCFKTDILMKHGVDNSFRENEKAMFLGLCLRRR